MPDMAAIALLLLSGFFACAILALVLPTRVAHGAIYGASLGLSLALLLLGGHAIAAPPSVLRLPIGLPGFGSSFRLDALAAAFLALLGLGGAGASLFGLGYGRHSAAAGRVLPAFPAFLGAMGLVLLAADIYSFLFAWEAMSLASWALVMSDHEATETAPAGFLYLLMASGGTLALMLGLGLLAASAGSPAFAVIAGHRMPPPVIAAALILALLGAGSKAGLVPLHAWLPLAHPAAPSHASALMSGVMTKIALYALIRITFDLLGPPAWWWGVPLLILGGLTAVMGVLYALMETDLKRVLACSTIENIGFILVAIGLALAFKAAALSGAAALALTAALFHAVNHMLFKSTLFFAAGAAAEATGTRDLERLGGLIHRMPRTALAFLVASLGIAALPPLNGFVSEWLIFQSILLSPHLGGMGMRFLVPAVGVLLALAAALAAACFLRAFGIGFLGQPRSSDAASAREADGCSTSAMLAGAALCLILGLFPGVLIDALRPVSAALVGGVMPAQGSNAWLSIEPISASRSSYNGLVIAIFLAASGSLTAGLIHRFASRALRRAPAWSCGLPAGGPETQYSATGFAEPLRRVFATLLFADRATVRLPPPGSTAPAQFLRQSADPAWRYLYTPLGSLVQRLAVRCNQLQFLTIRSYLSLVFATLLLLLILLAVRG